MPDRATKHDQHESTVELFTAPWGESRGRTGSFAASLCLHALAITVLVRVDWGPPPRRFQVPTIEQLKAEGNHEIIWYPLKADLPAIAPLEESAPTPAEGRARFRLPRQTIVANDPNPDSSRQVIRGPAPEITIEQDVSSPNLLAWNPPDVKMPRFEMAAREETAPRRRALQAEQAPEIRTPDSSRPDLALIQPFKPLRYRTTEREQTAPSRQALAADEAPRVETTTEAGLDLERLRKRDRLRFWTPEKRAVQPERGAVPGVEAPQVEARADVGLELDNIQRLEPLRYWTPQTEAVQPGRAALGSREPAPEVEINASQGSTVGPVSLPRLRYWSQAREKSAPGKTSLIAAAGSGPPAVPGQPLGGSGDASAGDMALAQAGLSQTSLNPPAPSSDPGLPAPQSGPGGGTDRQGVRSDVGDPAGASAGASGNRRPNLAVVGLDPDSGGNSIPPGQRRGRFSASPDGGPEGEDSSGATTTMAEVRVPNLSVSGAAAAPAYAVTRPPAPQPSREERPGDDAPGLDVLTRFRNPREYTRLPFPAPHAEPPAFPDAPEAMFVNRAVYSMAINMPNITSGAGSWIILFAEVGQAEGKKKPSDRGKLSAPSPRLKVDPKYVRSAVEEGVEGKVVLYAVIRQDGLVGEVRVIKSLDDRLDESAIAAFSKWRFEPATNDLGPVEVEAVVEIPFQLARPEGDSR